MEFLTTPNRVVNRFGKKYTADANGVIVADTKEAMELFVTYGFKLKEEPEVKKKKTLKDNQE